ncbi:MAG: phosphotransferase [Actinocatenispora sp.]
MSTSGPSPAALAHAASIAGPHAEVHAVRPLAGGSHAGTYLVTTEAPHRELVLREFPPGDDAAHREVRVLAALNGLAGLAPRLLAADPDATWSDRPSVLISRLPGTADLNPRDPRRWARELGRALARVHATAASGLASLPTLSDRPGGSTRVLGGPTADLVLADWERIRQLPRVLTHYDFWSGNVLWAGDTLSGVVDWCGAALGPAEFDVGWLRIDLYLLYDRHIADEFLAAYRALAGPCAVDETLADLWTLARSHDDVETWSGNYVDLGRADLTGPVLRHRHTAWTREVLHRHATVVPDAER